MSHLLEVNNLSVSFNTDAGVVQATDQLSFSVDRGETLAIVGESGSGKSVSSLAIMGLHGKKRTNISGSIKLNFEDASLDVITASDEEIRNIRGNKIAMIFQDPMSSLHPYYTIGNQLVESWLIHNKGKGSKSDARKRAIEMLDLVGIPDAARRVDEYPHQFSGGMRQRVMIALALINSPDLLIADEPTTALDVTVQSQILNLIRDMQKEFNMAVILITHDLGVVAEVSDRINVMYGGRLVEEGTVDEIFYKSAHPYTQGLLRSIPRVDVTGSKRLATIPGQPPSLIELPVGCAFAPRCTYVNQVSDNRCLTQRPESLEVSSGHRRRCFLEQSYLPVAEGVR
jgi:peptide/nickel transport system ATP-binding protein